MERARPRPPGFIGYIQRFRRAEGVSGASGAPRAAGGHVQGGQGQGSGGELKLLFFLSCLFLWPCVVLVLCGLAWFGVVLPVLCRFGLVWFWFVFMHS